MAKAAKKAASKPTVKAAAKAVKATTKEKPEKKAAPAKEAVSKKEAPAKKEVKKQAAPVEAAEAEAIGKTAEAPVEKVKKEKIPKAERMARAAAEKTLSEDLKKWSDFYEKFGSEKAQAYNMSQSYEASTPLQHKVLGWGYIVSIQNDRLEVLFESGAKTLISNYKPR